MLMLTYFMKADDSKNNMMALASNFWSNDISLDQKLDANSYCMRVSYNLMLSHCFLNNSMKSPQISSPETTSIPKYVKLNIKSHLEF